MKFTRYQREHTHGDVLFILLLLGMFSVGSLLSVICGANAYDSVNSRRDSSFARTTPLSYLASKVRQSDGAGAVRVEERQGVPALVLTDHDSGEPCETWIYEYEGDLRELYVDQGASFDLADGSVLLESRGLSFTLSHEDRRPLLTLTARDSSGRSTELTLALRGDRDE